MKIKRFERLRNCRIFRDFTWPSGLDEFEQFNLIFGWNGTGKTTLSALLRGLECGENTVGGECVLRLDTGSLDISKSAAEVHNIRVFNRDAVSRAVFEMPGSAQLSPVFVIGEKNVEIGKQLEARKADLEKARPGVTAAQSSLSAAEAELEAFCTSRARDIKSLLTTSGGGPYNNYDKGSFKLTVSVLQRRPAQPELTETARNQLLSKKEDKPKPKISVPDHVFPGIPGLTNTIRKALAKSVTSSVIQELADDPKLAEWVSEGLDLHRHSRNVTSCKFCGQMLPKGRIKKLEEHFNDEFNAFQTEIAGLLGSIDSMYKVIEDLDPPAKERLYGHLAEEYGKARSTFTMQRNATLAYLRLLCKAVEAKKEKPFQVLDLNSYISPDTLVDKEDNILIALLKVIATGVVTWGAQSGADAFQKLTRIIEEHNHHCDNFEVEIQKARRELELDEASQAMPEYRKLTAAIAGKRDTLSTTEATVRHLVVEIGTLEGLMRGHLEPAVRLTEDLANYLGRRELVFEANDTGYTITRDGVPASHLSEGEQTAIAFLYFLRSLEDASLDLKHSIIVVDDPASSLDENSIYSAFGYMKARIQGAAQIIVLTHNFRLFSLVRNWFRHIRGAKRLCRFYMLRPRYIGTQRCARITELDKLLSAYESDYHFLFKIIREEADANEEGRDLESYYPLPNTARKLLDGFLAYHCPGQQTLHEKVHSVEKFDVARRTRLLRFVDVYSHTNETGLTGHDPSILIETPQILKDVLAFIEAANGEHYTRMMAATGEQEE